MSINVEPGRSLVAVIRCEDYDYLSVKRAVERGIELIGGCQELIQPGEKILLKPNLLAPDPPEKCVTTHPAVFKAVAEVLLTAGALLSYGDSPAIGSSERAARKGGIMAAAEELGMSMADFKNGDEVAFLDGVQNKKFVIACGALACDGIVSLPKLKTHGLTRLTGAIKNQFGCIPGVLKGEFHVKLPRVEDFARMLVDLNLLLRPRLFVMDGIMAMEGNGPRGGQPRQMGVLLFSTDPVALDATVCRLVNLRPEEILTLKYGQEMGLGTYCSEKIDLVGDGLAEYIKADFKTSSKSPAVAAGSRWLRNQIAARPEIDAARCIECGICIEVCPMQPSVVDWAKDDKSVPPKFDYDRCIRCYCCQELCPEGAISLHIPWLGRLLSPLHA
jgi:uncharacterized protein (DUF362 family)/NAD-dependent dihydropyrimidine dehydrogenase PreA subunit